VAFTVATSAHLMADGHLPGPTDSAILLALAIVTLAPVMGRELSRRRMFVILAAAEVAIHVGLTVLAHDSAPGAATMRASAHRLDALAAGHTRALHDAATTGDIGILSSMANQSEDLIGSLVPDQSMLVAHVLSVLVLGFLLAHGEASLWSLLALSASVALVRVQKWIRTLPVPGLITAGRAPTSPPCLRRQSPESLTQRFADALWRPSSTHHRGPPRYLGAFSV
jgi:hypothetical protein